MSRQVYHLLALLAFCGILVAFAMMSADAVPAVADAAPADWPVGVKVFHDDQRGVTCWVYRDGISCLPNSQIAGPP